MATTEADAIRPFRVNVPEEELDDLRRRISATRWPERETVGDKSQGVPLAMMQELAHYWASDYDWRKCGVHSRGWLFCVLHGQCGSLNDGAQRWG